MTFVSFPLFLQALSAQELGWTPAGGTAAGETAFGLLLDAAFGRSSGVTEAGGTAGTAAKLAAAALNPTPSPQPGLVNLEVSPPALMPTRQTDPRVPQPAGNPMGSARYRVDIPLEPDKASIVSPSDEILPTEPAYGRMCEPASATSPATVPTPALTEPDPRPPVTGGLLPGPDDVPAPAEPASELASPDPTNPPPSPGSSRPYPLWNAVERVPVDAQDKPGHDDPEEVTRALGLTSGLEMPMREALALQHVGGRSLTAEPGQPGPATEETISAAPAIAQGRIENADGTPEALPRFVAFPGPTPDRPAPADEQIALANTQPGPRARRSDAPPQSPPSPVPAPDVDPAAPDQPTPARLHPTVRVPFSAPDGDGSSVPSAAVPAGDPIRPDASGGPAGRVDTGARPALEILPMSFAGPAAPSHPPALPYLRLEPALRLDAKAAPPAAASPPTLAAVPMAAVASLIARQAEGGNKHFRIRLDPPELGRIEVRLEVTTERHVSTHIQVERAETLDLLHRDVRTLERALAQAGLDSQDGALTFSLKDPGAGARGRGEAFAGEGREFSVMAEDEPDTNAAPVRPQTARPGLDIRI